MQEKDINLLLQKAEELKALFVLGQRVIPFLEEIFIFIREIQPLFDQINVSIQENLKKIPGAGEQLSKVTEANEMATNEIMDTVDGVIFKADIIEKNFGKVNDEHAKSLTNAIKLLEIIYKGIEKNSNLQAILPQLASSINALKGNSNEELNSIIKNNKDVINGIRNDASSIMISLQVQDITAQQLAAVNHMLFTIQDKLGGILQHFQSTDLTSIPGNDNPFNETMNISKLHRDIAFDPIAVDALAKDGNRQENVDDLINAHLSGDFDINSNSDDEEVDIDALFGAANNTETEANNESEVNDVADDDEEFDIDAMFSNAAQAESKEESSAISAIDGDLDEPIDPNDLDALFAGNNVNSSSDENIDENDESQSLVSEDSGNDDEKDLLSAFENKDDDSQFSQEDIDAMFGKL